MSNLRPGIAPPPPFTPARVNHRELLINLRASIIHWREDRECNLLPTLFSLNRALDQINRALAAYAADTGETER